MRSIPKLACDSWRLARPLVGEALPDHVCNQTAAATIYNGPPIPGAELTSNLAWPALYHGLDQRFLDTYERVDTMSYSERRAILRQFDVQDTLWNRHHIPRFSIDWVFDLGADWGQPDLGEEDLSWVACTRESANPARAEIAYSSSV